jgi:hypothetical protein
MWNADLRIIDAIPADVAAYLAALRALNVNGGVAFAQFEVATDAQLQELLRLRVGVDGQVAHILGHPIVRARYPEIVGSACFDEGPVFEPRSALSLDGELAAALVAGGAYKNWEGTPQQAKELGSQVCEALFGGRFNDVYVYQSHKAWSGWFQDVAWDHSWVLVDIRTRRVTLLCSTDTD